jgi:hypothetical protein
MGLSLPPGATLRTGDGRPFDITYIREAGADRYGTVALSHMVSQGDFPRAEEGRTMFVRNFGPELNRRILHLYPDRRSLVFVPKDPALPPEIVTYDQAMAHPWGVSALD